VRSLATLAAALLVACGSVGPTAEDLYRAEGRTTPPPPNTPGSPVEGRYGVAGLVPRNFPNSATADWLDLYRSFADTGGFAGVYVNWADSAATEGKVPAAVASSFAAAREHGFTPLVALGVARDASGGVTSTVDWSSAQRGRFIDAVTAVARAHRPAYLALGVESNRLWQSDPSAFDGFVAGYAEAYDAVKRVSPQTSVFTIFQLELMRGRALLMTAKESTPPQWDLIGRFAGKLDLTGFTTYPFFAHQTPADVPDDYYADAARRAPAPLALTEIGWPSAPLAGAPTSGFGGTPEEQAEFVCRLFVLTAASRPRLALWAFPNEYGSAGPASFVSVALRHNDGTAKLALAAWREGIAKK